MSTLGDYPDRGTNCLVCDSQLEPLQYVCTFCELTYATYRRSDSPPD